VRRAALGILCAVLLGPAGASARTTAPCASASHVSGAAPLTVSFSASCGEASYHWDFGDGTSADGPSAGHTFGAGRFAVVLTATAADGTSQVERLGIEAYALGLSAPRAGAYAKPVLLRGRLTPAPLRPSAVPIYRAGHVVGSAPVRAGGLFRLQPKLLAPGPWQARYRGAVSQPLRVLVRPSLELRTEGAAAVGSPLVVVARLHPAWAGRITVSIWRGAALRLRRTVARGARIRLDTRRPVSYRIRATTAPAAGFAAARRSLTAQVVFPSLAPGTSGTAVRQLTERLRTLHYAVRGGSVFGAELVDSLYAFQKVQGLPRTGHADLAVWRALSHPHVPAPRYADPASHLEIDKPHQVLYVVRRGRVALIVPVSTAGIPGHFTPVGRFAIYRKVVGFDPSPLGTLYDPMYFTGGYAIHGNPSVPPYPASHGCVRVPMWVAPYLYATNDYGEAVYVY
jgi:L,D-transpeptidase catalytic domain/PKD domain/Putative peptidoglycan binding domain